VDGRLASPRKFSWKTRAAKHERLGKGSQPFRKEISAATRFLEATQRRARRGVRRAGGSEARNETLRAPHASSLTRRRERLDRA